MRKTIILLFFFIVCLNISAQNPLQYNPTVSWSTVVTDVVMNDTTYNVTVIPYDINDPGSGQIMVGYYLRDFVGHTYSILAINVDGNAYRIRVRDDFHATESPQTGQMAFVYKSVGDGSAPYVGATNDIRLDQSARDYSKARELDIIWKNKVNNFGGISTNYLPKWNGTTFVTSLFHDNGISATIDGTLTIPQTVTGGTYYNGSTSGQATLIASAIAGTPTLTLPTTTGTLALTSQLSSYLPLYAGSGNALTGGLYGTTASFSGSATASSFIKSGGTSAQYLLADGSTTTVSGSVYKDQINGSTGVPVSGGSALKDGTGTTGWYYACSTAGTHDYGNPSGNSITLAIGDQIYYNGTKWIKIPGAGSYTLPIATGSVLGGIKSSSSVSVDGSGVATVSTNYQAPITGTGFVKAISGVISYDTNSYLTSITSSNVTSALGFTPYNATNPNNYIPLTALSSTATGLTYTNTTGVFSLTSGYAIPTTTNISTWNGLTSFPGFGTDHTHAAYGDHNHSGVYEPVISSGTSTQYWRGDKTFQTLNYAAIGGTVPTWNQSTTGNAATATLATNWSGSGALANYLPLVGGTLTGALNGTTGTFSGAVNASQFNTDGGTRLLIGNDGYLYTSGRYNGTRGGNILANNGSGNNFIFAEFAPNIYAIGGGAVGASITTPLIGINTNTGFLGIGYTADPTSGNKFAVNGNGYFSGTLTTSNFVSNVATGTQPFATTSTTLNTNLNADLLDGYHASSFVTGTPWTSMGYLTSDTKWDGGSTGLAAATGRTSLGLGNSAILNVGTTSGTVAAGDHNHTGVYQPIMLSITPNSYTSNTSFTLDLSVYVNAKISTNTAINCTITNIPDGGTGQIEITYTGAAIVTIIVPSSYTIVMPDGVWGSTTNAYTKALASFSSGTRAFSLLQKW